MSDPLFSLPLVAPEHEPDRAPSAPSWQGLTASAPLELLDLAADDVPEPELPQGEYGSGALAVNVPLVDRDKATRPVELLAPAGGPEAGFAAFAYGADAIYLGLKKFSARAEAENFTLEELAEMVAYAHSLTPARRVFVTINTLIKQDELPELVEALVAVRDIGVDALIIQDLGVYRIVRQYFPDMELHASTQLAVHNRAGAEALHRLGFTRVVLARELTREEVDEITSTAGIETEVFIHGALCYSYSGLCLFSSQTLGRSGNRGKCAYSCRDSYEISGAPDSLRDGSPVKRDPAAGFPFSMKDLALPDFLPVLRAAGVSCFKIEGRKKSPLYVATTTDYYRKLLDGRLTEDEQPVHEADLQAVFSRPWTRLFLQSHKDKEVADRDTVGHRGTRIGQVEGVYKVARGDHRIRFHTTRAVERHDGLQIDLPVLGKPFGFAVDKLWVHEGPSSKPRKAFEAPSGVLIEVGLPEDHPELPVGAPVCCSSSQDVKRRYRYSRPKEGQYQVRRYVAVEVELTAAALTVTGRVLSGRQGEAPIQVRQRHEGPFAPARDLAAMAAAARSAFDKFGDTALLPKSWTFRNDDGRFVPISRLNQARRDLACALELALESKRKEEAGRLQAEVCPSVLPSPRQRSSFRWSLKVDRLAMLDALEAHDWSDIDELVVDIARDHSSALGQRLQEIAALVGQERIRLSLPALTRKWEDRGLRQKIDALRKAGWKKWEVGNLSGWSYLGLDPVSGHTGELELATDWSVYVVNRAAAQQLLAMGVSRFALSPEDGLPNVRTLLAEFGARAVLIVHQDTPLFLAESCAYANLIGGCPGKGNCRFESMEMVSSHGEKVTALDYHCRTVVLNQGSFCLSPRLKELAGAGALSLRADFVYRNYPAEMVRQRWRLVRAGRPVPGGHAAHFDQGML